MLPSVGEALRSSTSLPFLASRASARPASTLSAASCDHFPPSPSSHTQPSPTRPFSRQVSTPSCGLAVVGPSFAAAAAGRSFADPPPPARATTAPGPVDPRTRALAAAFEATGRPLEPYGASVAQQKLEPRVEDMRDASRLAQRLTTPSSDYALPPRAADPEFDEELEPGDLNWLEPPPPPGIEPPPPPPPAQPIPADMLAMVGRGVPTASGVPLAPAAPVDAADPATDAADDAAATQRPASMPSLWRADAPAIGRAATYFSTGREPPPVNVDEVTGRIEWQRERQRVERIAQGAKALHKAGLVQHDPGGAAGVSAVMRIADRAADRRAARQAVVPVPSREAPAAVDLPGYAYQREPVYRRIAKVKLPARPEAADGGRRKPPTAAAAERPTAQKATRRARDDAKMMLHGTAAALESKVLSMRHDAYRRSAVLDASRPKRRDSTPPSAWSGAAVDLGLVAGLASPLLADTFPVTEWGA